MSWCFFLQFATTKSLKISMGSTSRSYDQSFRSTWKSIISTLVKVVSKMNGWYFPFPINGMSSETHWRTHSIIFHFPFHILMGCHPKPIDELTPSFFKMVNYCTTNQLYVSRNVNPEPRIHWFVVYFSWFSCQEIPSTNHLLLKLWQTNVQINGISLL